jgi:DNA-binding NtrC family response regulator
MPGERVLLVDDEADFVEALSARMEARGVTVETADSGPAALEKMEAQRFDVVVLDLAMPGMDGIETLTAMRERDPDVQVILLTGRATLQKGVEAMKLGAMDFLEKPADINLLLERIRQAKAVSDERVEQKTQQVIQDILRTKGW